MSPEGALTHHRLENEGGRIQDFFEFESLPAPSRVATEASGTLWWLVDLRKRIGYEPVLSHPKQTKAIAAARLKNARVDAKRLAFLLRADLLPSMWIPPIDLREARELLRHRVQLVWIRTGIKNHLQALLSRRNLQPTTSRTWMTVRGQRELAALPLGPVPGMVRQDCRALLTLLDEQIRRLDQQFLTCLGDDPRVRRLMTIPGIGPVIAIVLGLKGVTSTASPARRP